MVPMRVAHNDVGDFLRFYAGQFHRFVWTKVILNRPQLEPTLAMKPTVEQNIVPATANQPDRVHRVDLFVFRRPDHHLGDLVSRRVRDADRLNRVRWRLRGSNACKQEKGASQRKKTHPNFYRASAQLRHLRSPAKMTPAETYISAGAL